MTYNIVALPGDGIGPPIAPSKIASALLHAFKVFSVTWGFSAFLVENILRAPEACSAVVSLRGSTERLVGVVFLFVPLFLVVS